MKILYLTGLKAVHFNNYIKIAIDNGYEIHLLGGKKEYRSRKEIIVHIGFYQKVKRKILKLSGQYDHKRFHEKLFQKIVNKHQPDIIHAINADFWGVIATSISHGIPTIITCQGADIYVVPFESKKQFHDIKRALHKADIVQTLSEGYAKNHLIEKFEVSHEKIISLYWGIEYKKLRQVLHNLNKTEIRELYDIHVDDFVIFAPRGMRNTFSPIFDIINVAKRFREENINFKMIVLLWGNKAMSERFIATVNDESLTSNFKLINDFISHDEMIKLYSVSNVSVSLHETDETSATVLESMALNVIPVLSNTGTYIDRFEDNKNALYVENYNKEMLIDKFLELYHNYDKVHLSMQKENLNIIEQFYDRDKNMKYTNKIYMDLLKDLKQ